MKNMTNIIYEDATKIMSRGQIVIPVEIRRRAGLGPRSLVKVKLTAEDNIIIEPLEKKKKSLAEFIEKMKYDKTIYWTKADDKRRTKIRKLSIDRLKRLSW